MSPDLGGVRLLVLDRDEAFTGSLARELGAMGAEVQIALSPAEARKAINTSALDAFAANVELLDADAGELIGQFRAASPGGGFYLLLEPGMTVSVPGTADALVDDFLEKPIAPADLAALLMRGSGSRALQVADPLMREARPYFKFRSESMRRALMNLPRIAASSETVLITGETGTGKEIISRAVHVMSPRSEGPFIALHCGAIPETLIEGELFGHEKGSFTGADSRRKGKFELADRGTLLLDEIGEMPLHLQVRLLRVLEEGSLYRIGAERPVPVDVRVIAATRRDLRQSVAEGTFREDLYYRLSILPVALPPLRERVEDISLLAVHFMDRALTEIGAPLPHPKLSTAAIRMLEALPWPGNVRELRNVMTRVATLLPPGTRQVLPAQITAHLEETAPVPPAHAAPTSPAPVGGVSIPPGATLEEAERMVIEATLAREHGNRTRTARALGIGIRTLRRKLNG